MKKMLITLAVVFVTAFCANAVLLAKNNAAQEKQRPEAVSAEIELLTYKIEELENKIKLNKIFPLPPGAEIDLEMDGAGSSAVNGEKELKSLKKKKSLIEKVLTLQDELTMLVNFRGNPVASNSLIKMSKKELKVLDSDIEKKRIELSQAQEKLVEFRNKKETKPFSTGVDIVQTPKGTRVMPIVPEVSPQSPSQKARQQEKNRRAYLEGGKSDM